jgi:hypothetical protein
MALAKELDGLERPIGETLEVYEVLAAAEASVAWVVWNNALPCLFNRYLDSSARAEPFSDPTWLYASSTRPTGRAAVEGDGYRMARHVVAQTIWFEDAGRVRLGMPPTHPLYAV